MTRTTIDIDAPILRELKRLQKKRGSSLGKIASELLAVGLAREGEGEYRAPRFSWRPKPMGASRVDLRDKDAVWRLLDGE